VRADGARSLVALSCVAGSEEDQTPRPREPLSYQDIMHRLVARFIHQTKKAMKMDGVNEDDLLEIKQDISSLRLVWARTHADGCADTSYVMNVASSNSVRRRILRA
jgi:hypothetical protein